MLTFNNRGEIDMLAATTLGINAKESESPIGYFGTGLKYAIAGILRLGGRIEIWSGPRCHHFDAKDVEVRGNSYRLVTMDGQRLGFTTALGRNWKPWMLYRELSSNVMDEGGDIQAMAGGRSPTLNLPGTTSVVVHCEEVEAAHRERGRIFLQAGKPILLDGLRMRILDGGAESVFYRGIRAHDTLRPSLLTYDITERTELTEDRTISWSYLPAYYLACEVLRMDDADLIRRILTAGPDFWEHGIDFNGHDNASETFLSVAMALHANKGAFERCPPSLSGFLSRAPLPEGGVEVVAHLSDEQESAIQRACDAVCGLGVIVSRADVLMVRALGSGKLASVKNGAVLVAEALVDDGARGLAENIAVSLLLVEEGDTKALPRAVKLAFDLYEENVLAEAI